MTMEEIDRLRNIVAAYQLASTRRAAARGARKAIEFRLRDAEAYDAMAIEADEAADALMQEAAP
jgi:hypothetical protein